MMSLVTLPEELNLGDFQDVYLFDYHTLASRSLQRVILTKNVFSFLMKGTKEVYLDGHNLSIDSSKFLFMKSGNCLMRENLSRENRYHSLLLFFTDEFVFEFIRKVEFRKQQNADMSGLCSFDFDDFSTNFVDALFVINRMPNKVKKKLLPLKIEELLWYLVELHGSDFLYSFVNKGKDSEKMQKFQKIIQGNILTKLSLQELAFLCSMSLSSFKRHFEKYYKESPAKWFQNKRLEHAHYLLHQKGRNSSDIYLEIGYQNMSSFLQAYKNKFGITPKKNT